jgi:acetoin utilization deacetylase AcuC-like enzyme
VLLASIDAWEESVPASEEDVLRCHSQAHLARVRDIVEPTWLDPDTICSETSYEAALLAAGTAIEAARRGGFALVRPPGHHALPGRAMGFCLFDNIAIAARSAQVNLVAERVAILDWDVHHGNGTEDIFWSDPSVLFVSLHRWPFYPGTGGPGDGNETTVNVPLDAGSGDDEYVEAMERLVEPAIAAFEPELLLVSAGFDAGAGDLLGGMNVTEAGFAELARRARGLCERMALVLEGGYTLETLPSFVGAVAEAL